DGDRLARAAGARARGRSGRPGAGGARRIRLDPKRRDAVPAGAETALNQGRPKARVRVTRSTVSWRAPPPSRTCSIEYPSRAHKGELPPPNRVSTPTSPPRPRSNGSTTLTFAASTAHNAA